MLIIYIYIYIEKEDMESEAKCEIWILYWKLKLQKILLNKEN